MGRQLSCKKSLVVIFKILRVFVCTLSVLDKYSFTKRENLTDPIQMQLSRKQKSSCHIFSTFLKSSLNLDHCQKKVTLITYLFLRLQPRKTWLDQFVKSPASDYLSKRNMVNGCQLCRNLNDSTCTIFIDQWERN